jgi:ABC-type uncharacterized transport system involved in gliding motility auxiliary subunit
MTTNKLLGPVGLLVLAATLVAAVLVSNLLLRGLRLDLTENRLYTLSDGTYAVLEKIPEPINVYFFYSDRATTDVPSLRTYAGRVREMLDEFVQNADGRLNVSVIDPLPFSEEEDRAAAFGLQSINLGTSPDPIYMGIAATNSVGDEEIIGFLDPGKEAFLEYDLAKLIYTLSAPDRPVIGLLSGLQMTAGFDPVTQGMAEPWIIMTQIQQLFEVRTLAPSLDRVDEDVDVLMVVHPKELADGALYAIDQFVMRGGRALLFVDPYAEADRPQQPPGMSIPGGQGSDLNRLLEAWGVSVDPENVVGDDRYALTVTGFGNRPVRYVPLIGVDETGLDQDDVVTAGVRTLNMGFPGYIRAGDAAPVTVVPLVRSSNLAGLLPTAGLPFMQDPAMLRDSFEVTGETYVLAARLQGEVPSAFPAGPPPLPDSSATPAADGHLAASAGPINVVLVADTDLLTDRLWAQVQNFFGQRLTTAFAGNGDFVVNALDNLSGSSDLIGIRGRATYQRPFTRVQDLRREAEAQFRLTEQQLQQQLQELEAKLEELQASREDSNALILSTEQEAELERFQDERLRIRKELRQVQRELDQSIEDLGMRLKIINIALVPILISLISLGLLVLRRRRRAAPVAGDGAAA